MKDWDDKEKDKDEMISTLVKLGKEYIESMKRPPLNHLTLMVNEMETELIGSLLRQLRELK